MIKEDKKLKDRIKNNEDLKILDKEDRENETKILKTKSGKIILSAKQEAFCREYIKCNMNQQEAYKIINPNLRDKVLSNLGNRMLANVSVRARIIELLNLDELEEKNLISQALKAEKPKIISFSELHKFIELSLKLKGKLETKNHNNQNIIGIRIDNS